MGALSRIYTVKEFFNNATRDIRNFPENDAVYNERFVLVDRASQVAQALFSDVVSEAYLESTTAVLSSTGKYGNTTASYASATKYLTVTLSEFGAWSSVDEGHIVIFHDGTAVYMGQIVERISNTVVKLGGDNLPSSNIASVDYVIMAATSPTGDVLNLSSLRILRYGSKLRLDISSTVTTVIDPVTPMAYNKFRNTAQQNLNRIIWMTTGDYLYLKKGYSLSNYGTLTIQYPRLPLQRTLDADYVDLLDGAMCEIGIIVLKNILSQRVEVPYDKAKDKQDLDKLIGSLYNAQGGEITKELKQQKIDSILG